MDNFYYVLQKNYGYGHGWEDLCAEDTKREIEARKLEYEVNEGGTFRIRKVKSGEGQ